MRKPGHKLSAVTNPKPESSPQAESGETDGHDAAASGFAIFIRGLHQLGQDARRVEGESASATLSRALELDVSDLSEPIMYWSGTEDLLALDLDRPAGARPVDGDDIARFFPETLPRPAAAWSTHDGGLRAMFTSVDGVRATQLASVWALLAPLGHLVAWRIESKADSRHPSGRRGAETCGPVLPFDPSSNLVVPGSRNQSIASAEDIAAWLEQHGLSFGRHPHTACPWCGMKEGSCNPPVCIDERGLRCHRCSRSASWDDLVGTYVQSDAPSLFEAARNFVHLPHQRHVLHEMRPSVPVSLLQPAWAFILTTTNRDRLETSDATARDKTLNLIEVAASDRIDVARSGSGSWLDARTLRPRRIAADRTLREMPWARTGTMVDAAMNGGPLRGFVGLEPVPAVAVIAPGVEPRPGCIFVRAPREQHEAPPVDLGESPPSSSEVDAAWMALLAQLPGLNRGYLSGLVVAALVAQAARGLPPIIGVTGITGSSKTATVHIASAALGRRVAEVSLADSDDTRRQIGLALEDGRSPLLIDEIGRVRKVHERLAPILALGTEARFRAKYANETEVAVRAPVVFAGSTLPAAITRSPELARRGVGWRLTEQAQGWDLRFGDLSTIRLADDVRLLLDLIVSVQGGG